jgi:hypothetical protein
MTEFLQHLDYYLVASFKVGKQYLNYYAQGAFASQRLAQVENPFIK